MTDSAKAIAQRILDALAEAAEYGDATNSWYGYVSLDDVRALAEAVVSNQAGERWTSVFFRYQVQCEETHLSLEDALKFLHDGWYAAERSPAFIKGPDGQIAMDADQIAAHRQAQEAAGGMNATSGNANPE